ncbi:glycine zipper 2TM domain-containing protein [Sphingomonas sp. ABOLH]|nr:glycine zipper 2TM domain-containing protein [Sphingomonas sp. ABOLH]
MRRAEREYRRDVNDARRDLRRDQRDWRAYRNYNYNRFEPGQNRYWADRYYRDGRYYQPRRLTRNDRIYRGQDNRYYCRRSDGTTGLIIGGLGGGVLGNVIAGGQSSLLGTLIGGGAGALLGRSVDRGQVVCR